MNEREYFDVVNASGLSGEGPDRNQQGALEEILGRIMGRIQDRLYQDVQYAVRPDDECDKLTVTWVVARLEIYQDELLRTVEVAVRNGAWSNGYVAGSLNTLEDLITLLKSHADALPLPEEKLTEPDEPIDFNPKV